MPEEKFDSYEICLLNLKDVHGLDVRRIDTTPQSRDDGSVLKRSLITDGVIETGAEAAAYKAEYGTSVSSRNEPAGYVKHQYSWQRVEYACAGGILTGSRSQGFASPLFEPIRP